MDCDGWIYGEQAPPPPRVPPHCFQSHHQSQSRSGQALKALMGLQAGDEEGPY
jgi:hypothetical protein